MASDPVGDRLSESTLPLSPIGDGLWDSVLHDGTSLRVVKCFDDNYGYLLTSQAFNQGGDVISFDAPDGVKVGQAANDAVRGGGGEEGGTLHVLVTHGHHDHVGGMQDLVNVWCGGGEGRKVKVYGPDDERCEGSLGGLHSYEKVRDGSTFTVSGHQVKVMDTSGHTCPHISFHLPSLKFCMTGDSLFSLGCGRVFEGTMQQMFTAMGKYKDIEGDTWLACSHEYTMANARYLQSLEDSPELDSRIREVEGLREKGLPSVPVKMASERKLNAFLKAGSVEEFEVLRRGKDKFRG